MESDQRITQWENMTQADPENSMGWLSLGTAYKDVGRATEAADALRKAIKLDDGLSRAYQLLGQVLIGLNINDEAGEVLTLGYTTAAKRGDVMPQKAMASLLEKLGQPVPQIASADVPVEPDISDLDASAQVMDRRLGKVGARLADPPMRGPMGQFIYDHFSQQTWNEWIGMGTKVINELRLDFSNEEHQAVYDQQMMEWLGISKQEIQDHADAKTS